ncbi:hypothetical protein NL676_013175 [Syzygium grande]|nr:hypothetical protein NL676_013175 [Syzygium grande]
MCWGGAGSEPSRTERRLAARKYEWGVRNLQQRLPQVGIFKVWDSGGQVLPSPENGHYRYLIGSAVLKHLT